jgi:hypothetical protein
MNVPRPRDAFRYGISFYSSAWPLLSKPIAGFQIGLRATWTIRIPFMAPPSRGRLAALAPALIVTAPAGLGVGYVPIVTRQAAGEP